MAKSVVDLNMNGNEIQNVVLQNLAATPTGAKAGQIWYNSASNFPYFFNGTTALPIGYLPPATTVTLGGVIVGTNLNVAGDGTLSVPDATTTTKGVIEIATDTEASAGTATTLAVTPKQLDTKVARLSVKPTAGTYTKVTINGEGLVTTGASLSSTDVTTALGYTPYNSTNPSGYITATALEPYVLKTRTINGYSLENDVTLTYSDVDALPDTTTINDLTTAAQQAALNSGATTTNINQIATNTSAISTINGKIPSQASTTNQLADKNFVNSSISTNTAYFDGTWDTYAAIPTTVAGFTSAGYPEPTNNNYLVVKEDETQDGGTWRYKYVDDGTAYNKNKWKAEYEVNETPMTAAQLAALNSGITSTLVGQITTNQNDITTLKQTSVTASSTTTFTNKTIDAEGTGNSITNLKTSNFKSGVIVTTVGATGSDTALPTEQAVREALTALNNQVVHKLTATNPALTQSGGVCTWTISNTLATADVTIAVYEVATNARVWVDETATNSTITIKMNSTTNITANTYRAVIIG